MIQGKMGGGAWEERGVASENEKRGRRMGQSFFLHVWLVRAI